MTDLVVATDADMRFDVGAKALSDLFGRTLATTYPGYRWRVEPHPHPTLPFVDIRLEHATYVKVTRDRFGQERRELAPIASTVKPWQFYSASSLKAEIIKRGGEMLELANMNRRAFNESEFLGLKRDHATGLLILPTL